MTRRGKTSREPGVFVHVESIYEVFSLPCLLQKEQRSGAWLGMARLRRKQRDQGGLSEKFSMGHTPRLSLPRRVYLLSWSASLSKLGIESGRIPTCVHVKFPSIQISSLGCNEGFLSEFAYALGEHTSRPQLSLLRIRVSMAKSMDHRNQYH